MANINSQMTASGFAGALASVFTASATQFTPDSNLKAIISVLAGMTASAITFEFFSWVAILRLRQQRRAIEKLIPNVEKLQTTIEDAVKRQLELMKEHSASANNLKEIEKLLSTRAYDIAKVLIEVEKRSLDILQSVGR